MKDEAIQINGKEPYDRQCAKDDGVFCTALSIILFSTDSIRDGNDAGATTAVANGSQVMHMLTVILVGLAMGTTVVIGKAVGAKKLRDAQAAIGNTVTIFMIISVLLTVMLLIFINPIVAVMDTPEEAVII